MISPALLDSKLARYGSSSQIATPLRTRCHDCFMFAFTRRSSDSVTRLSFILLFFLKRNVRFLKLESRTFPQIRQGRYMCAGRMGATLLIICLPQPCCLLMTRILPLPRRMTRVTEALLFSFDPFTNSRDAVIQVSAVGTPDSAIIICC